MDVEGGREVNRRAVTLDEADLTDRATRLADLGVDVLICGAISRPLEAMLTSAHVRVIAQTCGSAEDVLRAFASGQLTERAFLMPGCCGRRRRLRRGRRW